MWPFRSSRGDRRIWEASRRTSGVNFSEHKQELEEWYELFTKHFNDLEKLANDINSSKYRRNAMEKAKGSLKNMRGFLDLMKRSVDRMEGDIKWLLRNR